MTIAPAFDLATLYPKRTLDMQFVQWLREWAWVKGRKGWQPFVLTRGQARAIRRLGFFKMKRGYWVALKARQVGFTTLMMLWSIWYCLANPGKIVLWVVPTEEVGAELLQTFREMVEWHRQHLSQLAGGLYPDNSRHSGFANGSRIKWAVIGGTEGTADLVARCAVCDVAVFSEFAYPIDEALVRVAMSALEPALERRQAPMIFDSTPNGDAGPGAPYYEIVCDIQSGTREGEVFLFEWWLEPDYCDPCNEAEVMATLDAEERAGVEEHGWTAGQVAWRRRKIASMGGVERFREVYVESLEGAFTARGGDHPVPASLIRETERRFKAGAVTRQLARAELERLGLRAVCDDDPMFWQGDRSRGGVEVWRGPQSAGRTWAAYDGADGLGGSDWQAVAVVGEDGRLCALAYLRIDPIRVAAIMQRLCEWYGCELLTFESQKSEPAAGALKRGARWEVEDVRGAEDGELDVLARRYEGKVKSQHTSEVIHAEAMDAALRVFGSADAIPSRHVLAELRDLRRKGGKLVAREGAHDDALMASGLAERSRRRSMQREAEKRERGGGRGEGRGGRGSFRAAPVRRGKSYSYLK